MGMNSSRQGRINDVLQRELAKIVHDEFNEPSHGMITISAVEVSTDLSSAKVYVTVLQDDKIQSSTAVLNDAATYIRGLIAKQVMLRTVPRFKFIYDDTLVNANHIEKLIASTTDKNSSSTDEETS